MKMDPMQVASRALIGPIICQPSSTNLQQHSQTFHHGCIGREVPLNPAQRGHGSDIYKIREPSFIFHMSQSDTYWKMGPIQRESSWIQGQPDKAEVGELSAVCIGTQVEGPSIGRKAVMKLKIQ